jgi:hypothetical protein
LIHAARRLGRIRGVTEPPEVLVQIERSRDPKGNNGPETMLLILGFVLRGLSFEFLDGLTRRQVLACEAGVVLRVTVGPED